MMTSIDLWLGQKILLYSRFDENSNGVGTVTAIDDRNQQFNVEYAGVIALANFDGTLVGDKHIRWKLIPKEESGCEHEWRYTEGFMSTWQDCIKCGAKGEDHE